jgi:hypothetical protein
MHSPNWAVTIPSATVALIVMTYVRFISDKPPSQTIEIIQQVALDYSALEIAILAERSLNS